MGKIFLKEIATGVLLQELNCRFILKRNGNTWDIVIPTKIKMVG
jgi:hypothetical protein